MAEKQYTVKEKDEPEGFIQSFSSTEEAELYNMQKHIEMPDMEKLRLFCRMMQIGQMLAQASNAE